MELSKIDSLYLAISGGLYLASWFTGNAILLIVSGFILGMWFVWKPPEVAVEGSKAVGARLGLSSYWSGVLSSFMSNIPEIFIVAIVFTRGYATGNIELLELTILIILATIGWNIILLGLAIITATRGKGTIDVPEEAISLDMELYRFTTIVLLILIFYLIIEVGISPTKISFIPPQFSFLLFLAYPIYLLAGRGKVSERIESHYAFKIGIVMLVLGAIGTYLGAELIVRSAEMVLEQIHLESLLGVNELVLTGLIVGFLSAIPEHSVALRSAYRGEIGISLGNLLGGLTQIILIILGAVGSIYPIPIDRYSTFQLASVALIMWFVKRSILDDRKLDAFEGIMILLIQMVGFTLLVS